MSRPRVSAGIAAAAFLVAIGGCAQSEGQPAPQAESIPAETWRTDEDAAFAEAKKSGRHVVVDFRATWCEPCKEVEAILAQDAVFSEITKSFVPLEFDISGLTPDDNELKAKYKAFELPAVIFVSASGDELGRIDGAVSTSDAFLSQMRSILDKHPAPDS